MGGKSAGCWKNCVILQTVGIAKRLYTYKCYCIKLENMQSLLSLANWNNSYLKLVMWIKYFMQGKATLLWTNCMQGFIECMPGFWDCLLFVVIYRTLHWAHQTWCIHDDSMISEAGSNFCFSWLIDFTWLLQYFRARP